MVEVVYKSRLQCRIHNDLFIQLAKNMCGISIYSNGICTVNAILLNHAHVPCSGDIYCQRYRFHEGDRVGILVDLDRQTLEYFHNGQPMGVAFEDVKGPVIPAVSFCHHKRVTLHYPPIPMSQEAEKRPRIIARSHSHAGDGRKTKKRHSESSDSTSSLERSLY